MSTFPSPFPPSGTQRVICAKGQKETLICKKKKNYIYLFPK
jgi:hypothetical protein